MAASVESNLCEPFENPVEVMESRAEEAARLLSALGQSKRLMVLCRLVDNEMSVGALAESVGLGQSALSQHLARLRDLGIVATRRLASLPATFPRALSSSSSHMRSSSICTTPRPARM